MTPADCIHEAIRKHGKYVVPFDMGSKGPPRGFVFDGDSCVLDLLLKVSARHDWDYLLGRSRWLADLRYGWGYVRKLSIAALWRYPGLVLGGWKAYGDHKRDRKETPLKELIAQRMVPDLSAWNWDKVQRTWLLDDLERKET